MRGSSESVDAPPASAMTSLPPRFAALQAGRTPTTVRPPAASDAGEEPPPVNGYAGDVESIGHFPSLLSFGCQFTSPPFRQRLAKRLDVVDPEPTAAAHDLRTLLHPSARMDGEVRGRVPVADGRIGVGLT